MITDPSTLFENIVPALTWAYQPVSDAFPYGYHSVLAKVEGLDIIVDFQIAQTILLLFILRTLMKGKRAL